MYVEAHSSTSARYVFRFSSLHAQVFADVMKAHAALAVYAYFGVCFPKQIRKCVGIVSDLDSVLPIVFLVSCNRHTFLTEASLLLSGVVASAGVGLLRVVESGSSCRRRYNARMALGIPLLAYFTGIACGVALALAIRPVATQ